MCLCILCKTRTRQLARSFFIANHDGTFFCIEKNYHLFGWWWWRVGRSNISSVSTHFLCVCVPSLFGFWPNLYNSFLIIMAKWIRRILPFDLFLLSIRIVVRKTHLIIWWLCVWNTQNEGAHRYIIENVCMYVLNTYIYILHLFLVLFSLSLSLYFFFLLMLLLWFWLLLLMILRCVIASYYW